MATLADLVVNLTAKADGYNKTFGDAKGSATSLGDHVGNVAAGIGKVVAGALIATGTALIGGLTASIAAAAEAEEGLAQLDAVLKSTGGAAGMTREELTDLAGALQKTTKFSDDAVIGAQSMLLTFTNIGKTVFPNATKTALDMSQALGQDLKSSSIQLGKALNDPIAGISALSRVGVTFTEDQKAMIKTMVEAGDVMGAQNIILAELNKEFGGSAEAAGKTFAGQLEIAKNQLGEFAEMIGGKILPLLTPLIGKFIQFATDALPQVEAQLAIIVPQIVDGLGKAVQWVIDNWPKIWQTIENVFNGVKAFILEVVVPIFNNVLLPAFNAIVAWAVANWPVIRDLAINAFNAIIEWVNANIVPFINTVIIPAFESVVSWVVTNWPLIRDKVIEVFNAVVDYITSVVVPFVETQIVPTFNAVVQWVVTNWPLILAKITEVYTAVIAWFNSTVVPFVNDTIIPAFNKVVAWVQTNWPIILAKVTEIFNAVIGFVNTTIVPFFEKKVLPIFRTVVEWVTEHWSEIPSMIESEFIRLKTIAETKLKPFIDFAKEQFKVVTDWVEENWPLIQKAVQSVMDFLNGKGPTQAAGQLDTFGNIFKMIFGTIKTVVSQALVIVLGIVKFVMQLMTGDTAGAGLTLKKVFADIFWGIVSIVGGAASILGELARSIAPAFIDAAAGIQKAFLEAFKSIYEQGETLMPLIAILNPHVATAMGLMFGNKGVLEASLRGIDMQAKAAKDALGTGKIDVLASLGITQQGLYDLLGINAPAAVDNRDLGMVIGGPNGFNGQATQGQLTTYQNQFNITTASPEDTAELIKRQLKLLQAAAVPT